MVDADRDVVDLAPSGRRLGLLIGLPVLVMVAVLVAILATSETATDRTAGSPLVGEPAPDVIGVDLDGADYDLRNERGRWTLVNFFSTTCLTKCPRCQSCTISRANNCSSTKIW